MEIYIVTSGCYSDYGIEKVFLDKEKAEHFAEWGEDRRVEVYNTEDDHVVEEVYSVHAHGRISKTGEVALDYQYVYKTDRVGNNAISFFMNSYCWLPLGERDCYALSFTKYIKNNNYNEQWLKDKYQKVFYDLANIIKYHLSQGATEDEIDKMLKFYWEESDY